MSSSLYLEKPFLIINGAPAQPDLIEDILEISVEESLHLPAMFTLVFYNPYYSGTPQDVPWKHQTLFEFGTPIKIGFSSSSTQDPTYADKGYQGNIIDGEVTAMETCFYGDSQAPIIIRGYDCSHRLHRGRYNRSFQNMSDTDIVKKIATEVNIPCGTLNASGGPYGYSDIDGADGYIFQENQTNMEFLRERAARIGFELFVQDGKLNFRKPVANSTLQLKWLEDINSFSVRVTSAEQVSQTEVRAWDYKNKLAIVADRTAEQVITATGSGKGSATPPKFRQPQPKMIVVNQPMFVSDEADIMAQALCNELGGEFVYADAKGIGNPLIRAGIVVTLQNMGPKYSGDYYVTETRHLYRDRFYSTEFSVRGLRGGDFLSTLSPPTRLQPGQTFLIGLVTDNKDPNGWGRVRVKFPTLTEEHTSYWARMVTIGAGPKRGFDCLPEIDDEVLVGFENGDIHRPFIIGSVWNGKDAPPAHVSNSVVATGATMGQVRLRTFKTRKGHILQFVDQDGEGSNDDSSKDDNRCKGVYLHTAGGHHVRMTERDAGPDQFVEIQTSGGHTVRLDDLVSSKGIRITTSGGHHINLNDTPQKSIDIQTTAGQHLTLLDDGMVVTLQTEGVINIQAGGEVNVSAGAAVSIEALADINLAAVAAVSIEAVTIDLLGVVTIDGMIPVCIPA